MAGSDANARKMYKIVHTEKEDPLELSISENSGTDSHERNELISTVPTFHGPGKDSCVGRHNWLLWMCDTSDVHSIAAAGKI